MFTTNRLLIAVIVIAAVLGLLYVESCVSGREAAEQNKQTSRSADAHSTAAKVAVDKVATRAGEHVELKDVVAEASKEIASAEGSKNAITPDVRAAARRAACRLPNYREHPACKMQPANP